MSFILQLTFLKCVLCLTNSFGGILHVTVLFLVYIICKFFTYKPRHAISSNVVCATSKGSDQPAHMHSLIRAFASRLNIRWSVKLLTEHHLEFLSLKRSCPGSSESTLVKMPHCWKSHFKAHIVFKEGS